MNEAVSMYNKIQKHVPCEEFCITQLKACNADGLPFSLVEEDMVFRCWSRGHQVYCKRDNISDYIYHEGCIALAYLIEEKRRHLGSIFGRDLHPFMGEVEVHREGTYCSYDIKVLEDEMDGTYGDDIDLMSDYLDYVEEVISSKNCSSPF